jgi:hypothetical protein
MSNFMEAVKGRVPLQTGYGSAASMKTTFIQGSPGLGVPRPDLTIGMLQFLSCFPLTGMLGLDHFYLRSPLTGLIKFLFCIGIVASVLTLVFPPTTKNFINAILLYITSVLCLVGFLLWYIWDVVQVFAEKDRVVAYGLSTPFDFIQGIAQGMVTDQKTNYSAPSSVMNMLSRYLGWLLPGMSQYMAGNANGGHRLMWISLVGFVCAVATAFKWSGWQAAVTFGIFHWILMIIATWHWVTMRSGGKESDYEGIQKFLNYYNAIPGFESEETNNALNIGKVDFSDAKLYQPIRSIFDPPEKTAEGKTSSGFFVLGFPLATGALVKMGLYFLFPWLALKDNLKAVATNPAAVLKMATNPAGLAGLAGAPAGLAGLAGAPAGLAGLSGNPAGLAGLAGNPAGLAGLAGTPVGLAGLAGAPAGLAGTPVGVAGLQGAGLAGLQGASLAGTPSARTSSKPTTPKPIQKGGAVDELSTESQILGATVFAIIGGGIMKAVVDNLI